MQGHGKIAFIDEVDPASARGLWRRLRQAWQRVARLAQREPRRLRLCESLPLGDRRFVAVIEFEKARFLVGGTSASLVLLSRLGSEQGCANASFANGGDSREIATDGCPRSLDADSNKRKERP